jgi:hypothetical protein
MTNFMSECCPSPMIRWILLDRAVENLAGCWVGHHRPSHLTSVRVNGNRRRQAERANQELHATNSLPHLARLGNQPIGLLNRSTFHRSWLPSYRDHRHAIFQVEKSDRASCPIAKQRQLSNADLSRQPDGSTADNCRTNRTASSERRAAALPIMEPSRHQTAEVSAARGPAGRELLG